VAVAGRRACATLAACSAVLHGIALTHAPNLAATGLMFAMLAMCLFCARDLWLRGTLRAWVLVALMNLAMIAIHVPTSPAHHHGGGVTAAAPAHHSTVMTLATALAAVEVVIAAAVVYYRTRALRSTEATSLDAGQADLRARASHAGSSTRSPTGRPRAEACASRTMPR
jgi:hypothetical protein